MTLVTVVTAVKVVKVAENFVIESLLCKKSYNVFLFIYLFFFLTQRFGKKLQIQFFCHHFFLNMTKGKTNMNFDNSKTEIVTRLKNSNCDKTQKHKL